MKPCVDREACVATFDVGCRFYHLQILKEVADAYRGRAKVQWRVESGRVRVRVEPVGAPPGDAWTLAGEIANEWLNRECRLVRIRSGRREAAMIVARCLSSALAAVQGECAAR